MNKYSRMMIEIPCGIIKMLMIKVLRKSKANVSLVSAASPLSEVTVDKGAKITIKKKFRVRSGAHIRVRKNAELKIGENVSVNHNCMIVCHEKIEIGNDVQFSPNVMVYDHDHDFRAEGGVKSMKYKSSPIIIGNNVWIGANSIILRGTTIGDDCVIGAGSVIKGNYSAGSVIVQKRETSELIRG